MRLAPGRLLRFVRLSSERVRQAVRQDCSFAKTQASPPALLVVVESGGRGVAAPDSASGGSLGRPIVGFRFAQAKRACHAASPRRSRLALSGGSRGHEGAVAWIGGELMVVSPCGRTRPWSGGVQLDVWVPDGLEPARSGVAGGQVCLRRFLPQEEARQAVAAAPQHFGPPAPVAVGAVLEPEGVRDPVDRVEEERDVDRLG